MLSAARTMGVTGVRAVSSCARKSKLIDGLSTAECVGVGAFIGVNLASIAMSAVAFYSICQQQEALSKDHSTDKESR